MRSDGGGAWGRAAVRYGDLLGVTGASLVGHCGFSPRTKNFQTSQNTPSPLGVLEAETTSLALSDFPAHG